MTEELNFDNIKKIEAKQIIDFVTVANDFCFFVENNPTPDYHKTLNYLVSVLPLLYLKGTLLPKIQLEDELYIEHYVREEDWETVFMNFHRVFQKNNKYYYYDNETFETKETSLAENIADIYQDLKDFLYNFKKPEKEFKLSAIDFIQKLFVERWGIIIVTMLPYIHKLLFESNKNNDNNESYEY